jgi:hypothetical protein
VRARGAGNWPGECRRAPSGWPAAPSVAPLFAKEQLAIPLSMSVPLRSQMKLARPPDPCSSRSRRDLHRPETRPNGIRKNSSTRTARDRGPVLGLRPMLDLQATTGGRQPPSSLGRVSWQRSPVGSAASKMPLAWPASRCSEPGAEPKASAAPSQSHRSRGLHRSVCEGLPRGPAQMARPQRLQVIWISPAGLVLESQS